MYEPGFYIVAVNGQPWEVAVVAITHEDRETGQISAVPVPAVLIYKGERISDDQASEDYAEIMGFGGKWEPAKLVGLNERPMTFGEIECGGTVEKVPCTSHGEKPSPETVKAVIRYMREYRDKMWGKQHQHTVMVQIMLATACWISGDWSAVTHPSKTGGEWSEEAMRERFLDCWVRPAFKLNTIVN